MNRTGHKCPQSGKWRAVECPSQVIPLSKGETFPPCSSKATEWTLEEAL